MSVTETRIAMIFNEWAGRYARDPESFDTIIDESGNAVTDYGERAMRTFCGIASEMDAANLLPTPELSRPGAAPGTSTSVSSGLSARLPAGD